MPWKIRDVAIAFAILFSIVAFGFALSQSFDTDMEIEAEAAMPVWLIPVLLFVFQGVPFGLAWLFGIARRHGSWKQLGLTSPARILRGGQQNPRLYMVLLVWPGIVFLSSVTFTFAYATLVSFLGLDFLLPDQGIAADTFGRGFLLAANAVIVAVWAPFTEEVFFRGFMLAGLVTAFGVWRGTLLSAGLFSLMHMQIGTLIPIFVTGLLFSWLYLKTRSIWPSMMAHAAQNAFTVFASTFVPNTLHIG